MSGSLSEIGFSLSLDQVVRQIRGSSGYQFLIGCNLRRGAEFPIKSMLGMSYLDRVEFPAGPIPVLSTLPFFFMRDRASYLQSDEMMILRGSGRYEGMAMVLRTRRIVDERRGVGEGINRTHRGMISRESIFRIHRGFALLGDATNHHALPRKSLWQRDSERRRLAYRVSNLLLVPDYLVYGQLTSFIWLDRHLAYQHLRAGTTIIHFN